MVCLMSFVLCTGFFGFSFGLIFVFSACGCCMVWYWWSAVGNGVWGLVMRSFFKMFSISQWHSSTPFHFQSVLSMQMLFNYRSFLSHCCFLYFDRGHCRLDIALVMLSNICYITLFWYSIGIIHRDFSFSDIINPVVIGFISCSG